MPHIFIEIYLDRNFPFQLMISRYGDATEFCPHKRENTRKTNIYKEAGGGG